MKKGILLSLGAVLAVAFLGTSAFAAPPWADQIKFDFGGYVKFDYIHQDAALSPISSPVTLGSENQDETLSVIRQSRMFVKVSGPDVLGATGSALVEGDFYKPADAGAPFADTSNPGFRVRHAMFTLDWKKPGTKLLFGQYWDIFAPMAGSTLDFDTGGFEGAPSNPRIAQIRLTQKVDFNENNGLTIIAGLEDPQQDHENSIGLFAGQVMFHSNALGRSPGYWGLPMQPLTAGVFGIYGKRETADGENIDPWGAGAYVHVPILHSTNGQSRAGTLTFEGQYYLSEGLNYGGMHANQYASIGTGTNTQAAPGYGAIGQFIYYPTQPLGITAGYGRRGIRSEQDYRDLGNATTLAGPREPGLVQDYNEYIWTNVTYDINNVRLGVEYAHFKTKYLDVGHSPDANRVQFSAIYFF